jgi:hypothetical protein
MHAGVSLLKKCSRGLSQAAFTIAIPVKKAILVTKAFKFKSDCVTYYC